MSKNNLIVKLLIILSLAMLLNPAMLMADQAKRLKAAELQITKAELQITKTEAYLTKVYEKEVAAKLRLDNAEEKFKETEALRKTAKVNADEGKKKAQKAKSLFLKAQQALKKIKRRENPEAHSAAVEKRNLARTEYREEVVLRKKTNKAYNISKKNFWKAKREFKRAKRSYKSIQKKIERGKRKIERWKKSLEKRKLRYQKLLTKIEIRQAIPEDFKGEATDTQVTLSWSNDNDNVLGFQLYRNGKLISKTTELGFIDDTVKAKTSYNYRVRAVDASSNKSHFARIRVRTLEEVDAEAPTVPTDFITKATDSQVTLSWSASSDNENVAGYEIYRDGVLMLTTKELGFVDDTVEEKTTYTYEVLAFDEAANKSAFAVSTVTTLEEIEDSIPLPPVTGQDLAQSCTSCHGPEGQSFGPAMPSLTGMNKNYFKNVMSSFKDGTRHSTMMGRVANGYSSDDIELMAEWFASQELVYAEEEFDVGLVTVGEELHNANCNSCHSSVDTNRQNGTLFGQYSGYLRSVLTDFSTGKSTDVPSAMLNKLSGMSADDIEALASYYASSKAPLAIFEAPTNLSEVSKTSTEVTLSWIDPNTERKAVAFELIRNSVVIANVDVPTYTDATIEANQSYVYKVVSIDKDGARSAEGTALTVSTSIDEPEHDAVKSGQELWAKNDCAACHSETTSFSSGTTVGALSDAINGNVGGMGDLFSGLTTQDQADLVAFINAQINPLPSLYNVKLLDNRQTLRKAMLLFAGRLPTQAEYDMSDTEEGLREAIRTGMNGENWDDFIFETGNMHFQTLGLKGIRIINYRHWLPTAERNEDAPLEGPVLLLHYLADNDRSYTEMLTADYTVASRKVIEEVYGAEVIGSYHEVRHENQNTGYQTYAPARLTFKEKPYPHAGVMSMPSWLGKFPTTQTNRNRHRANAVYQQFLGLNIEDLAQREIDDSGLSKFKAPLREAPACASCHIVMDPTAGMFQNWFDRSLYLERPKLDPKYVDGSEFGISHKGSKWYENGDFWYRDSFEPGFEDKKMPGGYKGFNNADENGVVAYAGNNNGATSELQWLAYEVIKDPRFATGAVKFWYKGLFGRDYTPNQELLLQEIGQRFKSNGFIVRDLLVDMVMSELFRADGFVEDVDQARADELTDWGTGRMLSTQQLERKTLSTVNWALFGNTTSSLGILYGGYDEGKVSSEINQDMTPSSYSILESRVLQPLCTNRLINEFTLEDANPVSDELLIKTHIKGLVLKMWDEVVDVDSEEVNRIYALYESVYNSIGDHESPCDKTNSSPSKRGWAAVGAYLLTDIKYVSE